MLGSNQRPPPCKGDALPAELTDYLFFSIILLYHNFNIKSNFQCAILKLFLGVSFVFSIILLYHRANLKSNLKLEAVIKLNDI